MRGARHEYSARERARWQATGQL